MVVLILRCLPLENQRGGAVTESYQNNQGELKENPLIQLPLGAVKANSWLENQLLLMKNGLTGNMREFNDYNEGTSAWLGNPNVGEAWENGPYYARGLTALAYSLDDADLIEETLKWVAGSIDNQREDGYFGPRNNNAWWSRMPMLCAVRDFYEAVSAKPESARTEKEILYHGKVLNFLERYFRYQQNELPHRRLSNWADARGGDNLEVVYWLYNQLYDAQKPDDTKWLLDLGDLIYSQTFNWENEYNNTTVRQHIVNTSQGMKTPAVYSQYKDGTQYQSALSNGLDHFGIDHGRIDGLPNSDEAARENRSTRGAETCSTVEAMLSGEIAAKISGEAWIGDRLELLAYNTLPTAYTPDYSGHTYYVLQNQVMATLGNHEFECDHGDSSAFGAPLGFDCCFSNNHMGWAKFVQNMWMATADGGLAVVAYGPNQVTAKVADGKTARFLQKTDYPFKDTVNLEYYGEGAEFELKIRIPEWANTAQVTINEVAQNGMTAGEYYTIQKNWKSGDKVKIVFGSEIKLTTWYNNSTAVQKGALIYGLKIEEDWRTYDSNDARELKVEHKEDFPLREVYPASAWNYGLVTDERAEFTVVEEAEVALQPFSAESAPIKILAKGQILPEWTLDGNIAGPQPYGPVKYEESELETITLIPYGSSRLRITHFPTLNNTAPLDEIVRTEGETLRRNGIVYQNFDNLVVPKATNYKLVVKAEGSGTVIINSKYSQDVSGDFTIDNLKSLVGGYFRFDAGQYNNVRFTGDIVVNEVKVEVVGREIEDVQVIDAVRSSATTAKIQTNLDEQETPYEIIYGTESGEYTKTVRGFSSATAVLTGLDGETEYFAKAVATVGGIKQESDECILAVSGSGGGGIKPNPNVPNAVYTGFNTLNYMTQEWVEYDPDNKVNIQASVHGNSDKSSEIQFGDSGKMKAVLNLNGSANWVDYVVEADITVTDLNKDNGGIMFRAREFDDGPDGFRGYYVGIGRIGSPSNKRPGVMVGFGNVNSWHDLRLVDKDLDGETIDIVQGQKYTLKVVVYGSRFAVYLDNKLVYVYEGEELFGKGTIGVRSYETPMVVHDVRVRAIIEDDLRVFAEEEETAVVLYEGFNDLSGMEQDWQKYDPDNKVHIEEAKIWLEDSPKMKAVLDLEGSADWTDYVVETDIEVAALDKNNGGIIFRARDFDDGPDGFRGYYVGIGKVHDRPGLMLGWGNVNSWNDIQRVYEDVAGNPITIEANQRYKLKVTVYGSRFAVYLDNELVYVYEGEDRFGKGTVGIRSYETPITVHDLSVRSIIGADLDVFASEVDIPEPPEDGDEEETLNFTEDFANDDRWTKIGNTGLISLQDGALHLGNSDNVKATAGDDAWSDFVYSAQIKLGARGAYGNAGMIFRTTGEAAGANGYHGYYFGIDASGYQVGKASGEVWAELQKADYPLDAATVHELKVIAYQDIFVFYIDGEQVYMLRDSDHGKGKIGVRGYNHAFAADNIVVTGLEAEDLEIVEQAVEAIEESKRVTIEGYSAYNSIQVKYPKVVNASSYHILYGTEPGNYTNEFVDVHFNSYKGSGVFTHDKVAFSTAMPGTYYVKVLGFSGTTQVAFSNEIEVTTGERADTTVEAGKMAAALATAKQTNTAEFTRTSKLRYETALAYVEAMLSKAWVNQMEYALAADLLSVAVNTPHSRETTVVDTATLSEVIAAKALDATKYTKESYDAVLLALANIEAVDQTDELAMRVAVSALSAALGQLQEKASTGDPEVKPTTPAVKPTTPAAKPTNPTTKPTVTAPKKGSTFFVGNFKYKVVKVASANKQGTVQAIGVKNKNVTSINIKATVKLNGFTYKIVSVGNKAFKNLKKVKKVTIGNNVTSIGKEAFRGCNKITKVTIGKGVKTIGNDAFRGCTKLTKVTIGKGLTKIGARAFYGNKKLKSIVIKSTKVKTVGKNAFKGIHNKAKIKVPKSKVKSYQKLFKGKGQKSTVKITK